MQMKDIVAAPSELPAQLNLKRMTRIVDDRDPHVPKPNDPPSSGASTGLRGHGSAGVLCANLAFDPQVGFFQTLPQGTRRRPSERSADQPVVGVSATHAERPWNMPEADFFPGNAHHEPRELVDGDRLLRADIERTALFRAHQSQGALDAFVDVEE